VGAGGATFSTGTGAGAGTDAGVGTEAKPGGGVIPGGGALIFVLADLDNEIGFFLGEACRLGGLVLCVESDDFPLAIDIGVGIAFFFSFSLSVRVDPTGSTEGEGEGGGKEGFDLSETRLPILSVLGVLGFRGTVLTEMFLPHPAELGSADAASSATLNWTEDVDSQPGSSAAGFGQCDLIVSGGGAA